MLGESRITVLDLPMERHDDARVDTQFSKVFRKRAHDIGQSADFHERSAFDSCDEHIGMSLLLSHILPFAFRFDSLHMRGALIERPAGIVFYGLIIARFIRL